MKNVTVFGYFGYETNHIDGQSIKTRQVFKAIDNESTSYSVNYFDTEKIKSSKLSFFKFFKQLINTDVLYYLPGQSNLKFIFPIIYFLSKIFSFKIVYPVVGGWLASFVEKNSFHKKLLSKVNGILVESELMKQELIDGGLTGVNIEVLYNFRIHNYKATINSYQKAPLKLVFMARIVSEKGIFRIIDAFERSFNNSDKVLIDFYGLLFDKDKELFLERIKKFNNVHYCGVIKQDEVHQKLNEYDALLLPTSYSGEGFPGTIIDSYIAGIPVIASRWRLLPNFIEHGRTGFLIELDEYDSLDKAIFKLLENSELVNTMKINALKKSDEYSFEKAKDILLKYI